MRSSPVKDDWTSARWFFPIRILMAVHCRFEDEVRAALRELAAGATGSSTFIARALVLSAPPDVAAGEMTDKGAVSQKAVLRNRAHDIARLFAEPCHPDVILPDSEA